MTHTTAEILRLPLESPHDLRQDAFARRGLHVYAHGTDLALGVSTMKGNEGVLRLLRLDTTLIGP